MGAIWFVDMHQLLNSFPLLSSRKCQPLWQYEDITRTEWTIRSAEQIDVFLQHVLKVSKRNSQKSEKLYKFLSFHRLSKCPYPLRPTWPNAGPSCRCSWPYPAHLDTTRGGPCRFSGVGNLKNNRPLFT